MSMSFHHYQGDGVSQSPPSGTGHSLNELFLCRWVCENGMGCSDLIRGHNISAHLREVHGIRGPDKNRVWCLWNSCNMELNKESLVRHVEEIHLGIAYKCGCGCTFTRRDTLNRHRRTCGQP